MEKVEDSSRSESPETYPPSSSLFELDEMNASVAGSSSVGSDSVYSQQDSDIMSRRNDMFKELISKSSLVSTFSASGHASAEVEETSSEHFYEDIEPYVGVAGKLPTEKPSTPEKNTAFNSFSK